MRKKGMADISYCNTYCMQENCERNLNYRKPPTKVYSVASFDEKETNELHSHCSDKLIKKY